MIIALIVLGINIAAGLVIYGFLYALNDNRRLASKLWANVLLVVIILPLIILIILLALVSTIITALSLNGPDSAGANGCCHTDGSKCDCDQ